MNVHRIVIKHNGNTIFENTDIKFARECFVRFASDKTSNTTILYLKNANPSLNFCS